MSIPAINHVILTVSDIAQSRKFYGDLLGFELHEVPAQYGRLIYFPVAGHAQVWLIQHNQTPPGDRFSEFRIGLDHLAFTVPDKAFLDAIPTISSWNTGSTNRRPNRYEVTVSGDRLMAGLSLDRDTLLAFLLRAKRAIHAEHDGNGGIQPDVNGSRRAEYREGDLLFRDESYGYALFSGEQHVRYLDRPLWVMRYAGGVVDEFADSPALYTFLHEALTHGTADRPFRGPEHYTRGACVYADTTTGDVAGFYGVETVLLNGRLVYELRYNGGLVREA